MIKQYHTGLLVGKFLPLHIGHEALIHKALKLCDKLIILVYYDKGIRGYDPVPILQKLYPKTSVNRCKGPREDANSEDHRQFCADYVLNTLQTSVQAVFTSDDYGPDFAKYLTGYFKKNLGVAAEVTHEGLDRSDIPICGTALREDPSKQLAWVSYKARGADTPKIAIIGGECSGKTTLAVALSETLKTPVVWEYGRRLQDIREGNLHYEDMYQIGLKQVTIEGMIRPDPGKFLICDTTPVVTVWFSQKMFGRIDPRLDALARNRYYDYTFICSPEGIPYEQDGYRLSDESRFEAFEWYKKNVNGAYVVDGSSQDRVDQLLGWIKRDLEVKHGNNAQ